MRHNEDSLEQNMVATAKTKLSVPYAVTNQQIWTTCLSVEIVFPKCIAPKSVGRGMINTMRKKKKNNKLFSPLSL